MPETGQAPRARTDFFLLALVLFGSSLSALAFVTVTPGLPRIAAHFAGQGDNTLRAQFVLTMAPVGMAFGGLTAGWVISRFGLRRTLFTAFALAGLMGLSPLYLDNLYAIFVSRFLLGCSTVTIDICMTTILSGLFDGDRRAHILGFKQGIGSCFTVGGTLVSGLLVQAYGWRAPFWVFLLAFVYLALAALALQARAEPAAAAPLSKADSALLRALWPVYALVVVLAIAHTMPHFQLPFLLAEDGMTNAAQLSRFPAASSFVSILSALAFGWVHARAGRWTVVGALALMGASFVALGVAPTFLLIFVSVVVEGFGGGLMLPYLSNQILARAPVERRSHAFGILLSTMFIGQFFDPIVIAPIRHAFGIHEAFVLVGVSLVVIASVLALAQASGRRSAGMPRQEKVA